MDIKVNIRDIKLKHGGFQGVFRDGRVDIDELKKNKLIYPRVDFCKEILKSSKSLREVIEKLNEYEYYPTITFLKNNCRITVDLPDEYEFVMIYEYCVDLSNLLPLKDAYLED